jgi:N-6 DNA Methylase
MPLSWNEIRARALDFSQRWQSARREAADKQTFYNEFFEIFGIKRQRIASFEEAVKKLTKRTGFIDLLWRGVLLVEHKTAGENLDSAYGQALDYFSGLKEEELPKYILVSDFQRFRLYNLVTANIQSFTLAELYSHIELFGFIAGYEKREFKDQDPVNIEASELMGKLHDALKEGGYTGHYLELFLVRLLFCLFADDTGIFERDILHFYLEDRTTEDGSDLGPRLAKLFETLNTPREKRSPRLDESLAQFPYVNGSLFADILPIPDFDSRMRASLINACYFDWGRISPAIFGSLFQSVMDKDKRRGIGAHYTTEKNIMKVLKPLFLDALYTKFEGVKHNRNRLGEFYNELASLTFLDPACGAGNFLILAYRELRLLEIEVLRALYPSGQLALDVADFSRINVDAFYGIEIEEFPARIAEVALWLMDHQMNMRLSEAFGRYYVRIPLRESAHIHNANALRLDWQEVVPKARLSYIMGNPPFVGKKEQNQSQKADMDFVFGSTGKIGVLDYVSAWYRKSVEYMAGNPMIKTAFVSTNSITQGEQVGVLWSDLLNKGVRIQFAHRTFQWTSEAKGKAAVHCVILGFALHDSKDKLIFDYDTPQSEPHEVKASNINPYLVDAEDIVLTNRGLPISECPEINYGSFALDNGNYTLSQDERDYIVSKYPTAAAYLRPFIGGQELLYGESRYCLWLLGANPKEIISIPPIKERVEAVRTWRLKSNRATTKKLADTPYLFAEIRQPKSTYLALPTLSSEKRNYIPIGFLPPDIIASNQIYIVPNASLYDFGMLTSAMHMSWVRSVCGRLESRYRYSVGIVYNNYPWPFSPTPARVKDVEAKAQAILDARALYAGNTLAQLYDPLFMPEELIKAHRALDRSVDMAYRKQPFDTERHRVEYLFELHQQFTAPLTHEVRTRSRKYR